MIFLGVIFSPKCEFALLYLGPSVPEILIGVIFTPSRPSVPKTYNFTPKQLLLWRRYFANLLLFFPVSHLLPFVYIYIFIQLVLFCLLVGSFN